MTEDRKRRGSMNDSLGDRFAVGADLRAPVYGVVLVSRRLGFILSMNVRGTLPYLLIDCYDL